MLKVRRIKLTCKVNRRHGSKQQSRQDGTCQLKVGCSFGSSFESWSSFDPKQPMLLTGFITLLVR